MLIALSSHVQAAANSAASTLKWNAPRWNEIGKCIQSCETTMDASNCQAKNVFERRRLELIENVNVMYERNVKTTAPCGGVIFWLVENTCWQQYCVAEEISGAEIKNTLASDIVLSTPWRCSLLTLCKISGENCILYFVCLVVESFVSAMHSDKDEFSYEFRDFIRLNQLHRRRKKKV
jgi:hypothetical protein